VGERECVLTWWQGAYGGGEPATELRGRRAGSERAGRVCDGVLVLWLGAAMQSWRRRPHHDETSKSELESGRRWYMRIASPLRLGRRHL
jgi:hypothetical protein